MKIYLIRHGLAADRAPGAVHSDAGRELTDAGREETALMARAMKRLGVKPGVVLSSPLVRACQTADLLQETLGGERSVSAALMPGTTAQEVFKELSPLVTSEEIVLVGHEPDMGDVAAGFVRAGREFCLPFVQTGVLCVSVSDVPPTMPGIIKWLMTPAMIRALLDGDDASV